MKLDQAKQGGVLAAQIEFLDGKIADVKAMLSEDWQVSKMLAEAPGRSLIRSPGSQVDILSVPLLDLETSKFVFETALTKYQEQRAALVEQLDAM